MRAFLLLLWLCVSLPAYAQDFQKFVNDFPKRKQFLPPYGFDSTYWAGCETKMRTNKLKRIPHDLVKKFIEIDDSTARLRVRKNSSDPLLGMGVELPDAKEYAKSNKISFYILERIELMPNFTNLIVYYSNEFYNNVNKKVLLLSYDAKGMLISSVKLIEYQTFVDTRLHTATIDGNYTLGQKETSYIPVEGKKGKYAFNFRKFKYFKLDIYKATFTEGK